MPHEHPLRSLQLDSLSELNLYSRDNSFEFSQKNDYDQGNAAENSSISHFRDATGRRLEITGV